MIVAAHQTSPGPVPGGHANAANSTAFIEIAAHPRTNRPGSAMNHLSNKCRKVSNSCRINVAQLSSKCRVPVDKCRATVAHSRSQNPSREGRNPFPPGDLCTTPTHVIPNVAKRSEESRALVIQDCSRSWTGLLTTAQHPGFLPPVGMTRRRLQLRKDLRKRESRGAGAQVGKCLPPSRDNAPHAVKRPRSSSTRPSTGTRCCCMVSRSRMVTAWSSRVSKSTVTQRGVPISSWRR